MRDTKKSKGLQRGSGKERVWRERMAAAARSGASVRAFCREIGVSEASFYFWRRKLASQDREPTGDADDAGVSESSKRRRIAKPGGKVKSERSVKKKSTVRKKKSRPILAAVTIVDDTSPADERRSHDAIELITDDITIRVPPSAGRESLVMILDVLEDRQC